MDKVTDILLEALKTAMSQPEAQRLFKSGKLPGLFAGKTSVNSEAAERALREGLLEVVNTELKGKMSIEWVKITPRGIEFLIGHESPVRALDELHAALQLTQEGVPAWVSEIRRGLAELSERTGSDRPAAGSAEPACRRSDPPRPSDHAETARRRRRRPALGGESLQLPRAPPRRRCGGCLSLAGTLQPGPHARAGFDPPRFPFRPAPALRPRRTPPAAIRRPRRIARTGICSARRTGCDLLRGPGREGLVAFRQR
jgi:hypothetical protein